MLRLFVFLGLLTSVFFLATRINNAYASSFVLPEVVCQNDNVLEISSTIIVHPELLPDWAFTMLDDECLHDINHFPYVLSLFSEPLEPNNMDSLSGSCVLVHPQVILTAGHIAEQNPRYLRVGNHFQVVERWVLHSSFRINGSIAIDLALGFLEYPVVGIECAILPDENTLFLIPGNTITTVGFSHGFKKKSNPGVFSYRGVMNSEPWNFFWYADHVTIWFGDSGGAVVRNGILRGIMTRIEMHRTIVIANFAVNIDKQVDWIRQEIERNLN